MPSIRSRFTLLPFGPPAQFLTAAAAMLLMSACTTPQSWTTARTLSPGQVQHGIGLEMTRTQVETKQELVPEIDADDRCSNNEPCQRVIRDQLVPSLAYGVRVGALRRLEMGAKVSTTGQLQADTKVQVLRRRVLDLAINPVYTTSMTFDRSDLRALGIISLNVGPRVTLTAAPSTGVAMWHPTKGGKLLGESDVGVLGGLSMGAQFRGRNFAVTPSLDLHTTRWQSKAVRTNDKVVGVGLGFSWGAMPRYGLVRRR